MTTDQRLHRIVAAQPYPLLFATITSRRRPDALAGQGGAHVLPLKGGGLIAKGVVGFAARFR